MTQPHQQALHALSGLQQVHDLSIIRISEQISAEEPAPNARTSDVSADAFENPSPASLEADLSHYKELFSKLRFSYLEQVTKEKFIRSIVGDPPQIVSASENTLLESQLLDIKAVLKTQKLDVAELVKQLEGEGRELARRYERIQLETTQLESLPSEIRNLESSIETLKQATGAHIDGESGNGNMNLSLEKTQGLLMERERELEVLEREEERLRGVVPRKEREWERLEKELGVLEVRRETSVAGAREARRRKEGGVGGVGDDLEERGKWWRSVEGGVKEMLGV